MLSDLRSEAFLAYDRFMPSLEPVETERLRLVLPPPSSAIAVLRYFERNETHLGPWEPSRPPAFFSESFWRERLAINRQEYSQGASMRCFLERRDAAPGSLDRIVGAANFTNVVQGPFKSCFLGYGLDAETQGRGLMEEALRVLIPRAMLELDLHRIGANYQPTNERSGRLLRRLGFVVEGYARDYLYIDGAWRDHVLTATFREAWIDD